VPCRFTCLAIQPTRFGNPENDIGQCGFPHGIPRRQNRCESGERILPVADAHLHPGEADPVGRLGRLKAPGLRDGFLGSVEVS